MTIFFVLWLKTSVTEEGEVETREGRWYWMQMRPYRTRENFIAGVVITFSDLSGDDWRGEFCNEKKDGDKPTACAGYAPEYEDVLEETLSTDWEQQLANRAWSSREAATVRFIHTEPHLEPWRDDAAKIGYASSLALPFGKDQDFAGFGCRHDSGHDY